MRQDLWKWLFTWEGRVERLPYFLAGTVLVAVKYVIDSSVAAHFGESWRIWNYFLPPRDASLFGLGGRPPELYGILWAIAIPFFWIGIALTLRRLRDAGKPAAWIFLFFVPLANLALFLWLTLAPSASGGIAKDIPTEDLRTGARARGAALGIVLSVALGLVLVILSAHVFMRYAWGLFLGVPFLTGFVSSWFLNVKTSQSHFRTIAVSTLHNSSDRALPDRLEVRRADLPSDGASARSALLDCRWACCPVRFGLPQPSLNTADVRGLAGCTSVADVR